jgi:hypothetical protein
MQYISKKNIKLGSRTWMDWFKLKSCSNLFIKSSLHVVTVAVEVFLPKEKAIAEELEGQPN